ncbi:sarcosine oxidase [Murinocardiopsis flavida]|uniref:Sarcosine oxidase n=1 Tax=Murinocardiopsis flavida TaxID=645275 RepID=A0A2P8CWT1_9ACTN|nr:N-methyl-L-tryptophan oxidase [Murinocardiopsis flavida]PSK89428.1 sarcosine oxidase [Murinocardiopsis flavida]
MKHFPAIVVGCGGLGSAALYRLSLRLGPGVLGIEQFRLGHERGASQDHSRIIRLAQHQRAYSALAPAAYAAWREVEDASAQRLVTTTGGLVIEDADHRAAGDTGTRNIEGYVRLFTEFGVDHELLDPAEVMRRWPQFRLTGGERTLYQRDSGIVDARRANAVHAALARGLGARIVEDTPVRAVRPTPAGVEVRTDDETYLADRVVIAGDAWTNRLLADCGVQLPLTVTQEQVTYYATADLRAFAPENFPVFMWHGEHNFYGFPVYGEVATKLGQHMGGHEVTADTRTFDPDPRRRERYLAFLNEHIPGFAGPELTTKTCLYTIPPDQNFVLDTLPGDPRVVVAVGAGHAYKFAALIGTILAELALDGASSHPVDAFSLARPALTDHTFEQAFHS